MNPPPMPPAAVSQDAEHLKLLAIFHYVHGGLMFFASLFGLFYGGMGFLVLRQIPASAAGSGSPPPAELGWVFVIIGILIALGCITFGVCEILTGRWLNARKNRTFCLVIAGLECLSFPLGTALGVFTFVVLLRPSAAALFPPQTDQDPGLNA